MADAKSWVAPLPRRIEPGDPEFRQLAVDAWCDRARSRGAEVEVTAIHRWITSHIADVAVDGVPYVLGTLKLDGWYHVIAWLESEVSGSTSIPDDEWLGGDDGV